MPTSSQLKAVNLGAKLHVQSGRLRRMSGMTETGKTPEESAERFRQRSAAALGVEQADLLPTTVARAQKQGRAAPPSSNGVGLMWDPATGKHKFRLYTYEQQRDGVPVFRGTLRTLVREDGDNPVVWANADLRPMGNFRAKAGAQARAADVRKSLQSLRAGAAQSGPAPAALADISAPTPTIYAGAGAQAEAPRMAIQYTARAADGDGSWTFIADAETGDVLHAESNLHFDVSGTVRAEAITGPESMDCGELGNVPLPYANVRSSAGNAVTEASGAFRIVQSGNQPVTVTSDVTGKFFRIVDRSVDGGATNTVAVTVTPPGPADFLHRDTQAPPERVLAQLNAYKGVNEIRDFLLRYVPEYPVISGETGFEVNVNDSGRTCDGTGGAYYNDDRNPRSITFCQSNGLHPNTAFGSIVHHEYGHHIVDSAVSGQSAYGEGMADAIAVLFSKDPRIGIGYNQDGCQTELRTAINDCQYSATSCSSCGDGLYQCGGMLTATIWDIWKQLEATEPQNADDIIRSLVLSSIPMHSGTTIDETIAIDLLTLDDDDGLLENGTPHYDEICAGFELHGMNCPALVQGLVVKGADLDSEGPSDGPYAPASTSYTLYNLGPQQDLAYSVRLPSNASWLSVDSTGGTIALGQKKTITVSINQAQAALLPDGLHTATIEFVNATSGVGTTSHEAKLLVDAPVPVYTATFDSGMDGFTIDAAFENLWHRSTACVDAMPGHTSPGSLYYGKDTVCDYNIGSPGLHTVTSPVIQIANARTAELGFKYYLRTDDQPETDQAEVLVSVEGGPFQRVASNKTGGETLVGTKAWTESRFAISQLLPPNGGARIRLQFAFNARTTSSNAWTGFVVDDINIYAQPDCTGSCVPQNPCASFCANPITYRTNGFNSYSSGDLGTGATCHETTGPFNGGTCGNFSGSRRLLVNGVPMRCDWTPWRFRPGPVNGGYCIQTTSGNYAWAAFTTW